MTLHHALRTFPADLLAAAAMSAVPTAQTAPLAMDTARVTIAGTSNIHDYTRVDRHRPRDPRRSWRRRWPPDAFWDDIVKPGALEGFEIAIPAATLTSPKEGLDKNMHKALKVDEHPRHHVPAGAPRARRQPAR